MKAIIIGATSGIGRELAKQMSAFGYELGITGRRVDLLTSLALQLPSKCYPMPMDVADTASSVADFALLLQEMGDVDLVIINAGIGNIDASFPLHDELNTISVNVAGFTAIANASYHYFADRGKGHIVATSSIAALRGGVIPAYNASKAYVSNYLEGLICKAKHDNINVSVTDIRPGFVNTAMAKGDGLFWVTPLEKASKQIFTAIQRKKRVVYVSKRWRLIAFLMLNMPFWLYRNIAT